MINNNHNYKIIIKIIYEFYKYRYNAENLVFY